MTATEWNAIHGSGVRVLYRRADGTVEIIWTTSTAIEVDGVALVRLEGREGLHMISKMKPTRKAKK